MIPLENQVERDATVKTAYRKHQNLKASPGLASRSRRTLPLPRETTSKLITIPGNCDTGVDRGESRAQGNRDDD